MSVRRAVVEVDVSTVNVAEFCREHGISRWLFYELRRRYMAAGESGLLPRSRAPHRVANKTSAAIEDLVVAKRKELVDVGLDAGAESIAWWLRDQSKVPSTATIWRILSARGFITPEPRKAPQPKGRSFEAERANESWQLDDTAWVLADGTEAKILNVLDDHSRLAVASVAMRSASGAATLKVLTDAAVVLGWPERFQSDNAKAFRHVLTDALGELGVTAAHSRPYHPQTNGKVERFHQTLKRWLAKQPPAADLVELQTQLDAFRDLYNHHRPHRSLARRHPAQVWLEAPKAGPADRPVGTPSTVHEGTVSANGCLSAGRRYTISLGAAHAGRPALTVITGINCHVFIDGRLARHLTLNPNRRLQPLYNRPGRPPRLP